MREPTKIVFFDFDGVILRSEYEIYKAVCRVFAEFRPGVTPPTFARVWQTNSAPYADWWREALGVSAPYEQIVEAYDRLERIDDAALDSDAEEVLRLLDERRILSFIVSASPEHRVKTALMKYGMLDAFHGIHGRAETTKDVVMRMLLEHHSCLPKAALMVGDRPSDIRDGRNAGVRTVAYTGGHDTDELLGRSAPDHIITKLRDLIPLLGP